jgi:hypothetical protein
VSEQTQIFLVYADTMYEGSYPVRAFASEEAANAFVQQCRDYGATRLQQPAQSASDAEWNVYWVRDKEWETAHPAAPFTQHDYSVSPLAYSGARPDIAPLAWATTYECPPITTARIVADMNERQREYVVRHAARIVELVPGRVIKGAPFA